MTCTRITLSVLFIAILATQFMPTLLPHKPLAGMPTCAPDQAILITTTVPGPCSRTLDQNGDQCCLMNEGLGEKTDVVRFHPPECAHCGSVEFAKAKQMFAQLMKDIDCRFVSYYQWYNETEFQAPKDAPRIMRPEDLDAMVPMTWRQLTKHTAVLQSGNSKALTRVLVLGKSTKEVAQCDYDSIREMRDALAIADTYIFSLDTTSALAKPEISTFWRSYVTSYTGFTVVTVEEMRYPFEPRMPFIVARAELMDQSVPDVPVLAKAFSRYIAQAMFFSWLDTLCFTFGWY